MIIFSRVAFLALGFVVPAVLISSAATAEDHVKCRVGTRKNKTITPKDYTAKYFDFRYEPAGDLSGHFHKNSAGYFVLDDATGGGSISPTDAETCDLQISTPTAPEVKETQPPPERQSEPQPLAPPQVSEPAPITPSIELTQPAPPPPESAPARPSGTLEPQNVPFDNSPARTVMWILFGSFLTMISVTDFTLRQLTGKNKDYINNLLLPSEHVLFETPVHWVVYLKSLPGFALAVVLAVAGAAGLFPDANTNLMVEFISLLPAFIGYNHWLSARKKHLYETTVITDHRIIQARGVFTRWHREIFLNKIESCDLAEKGGIIWYFFNCGDVLIKGVAGTPIATGLIPSPSNFRKELSEAQNMENVSH